MPRESHRIFASFTRALANTDATIAAVSDGEESDIDMIDEIPAKKAKTAPVKNEEENEDSESGEEDEDEFQVEKILAHKTHKGGILYRIKWLGYDDETDQTWEPEENLYVVEIPSQCLVNT